jgi:hypothetical protein
MDDEEFNNPRTQTSSLRAESPRVTSAIPASNQRRQTGRVQTVKPPRPKTASGRTPVTQAEKRSGIHWLLPLGLGMLAMLAIWVTGSWVLAWGIGVYNDFQYGNPRTFQTDAAVGHGDDSETKKSHFIAMNLNRQAIVFEVMAGDPSKSVSYVAPVYISGEGGEKAPVTVEFRDVNSDSKPDMIVHIHMPNQEQLSVFINDGKKFRPSNNNDKIRL